MAQQIKRGKDDNSINLVDLFFYLLNHWYWFALCILLACGYAYYKYSKTPFTYRADATVIIKDPSNSRSTARLDNYSNLINSFDMSNEILQLKSQQLMKEVVKTLDADVSYSVRDRLRFIELFNVTPVRMHFERNDEDFKTSYLTKVSKIRSDEYYVNMMTAWYFATALAKQYDATLPYIEKQKLDIWTHNKSIQKAVESYRITPEQKDYLKTLKRKA